MAVVLPFATFVVRLRGPIEMRHVRPLVFISVCLTGLAVVETASAKCKQPSMANPSVSEYIERIPTVCGVAAIGGARGSAKLPAAISRKLGQGATATALRNIATKQSYGAPQTSVAKDTNSGIFSRQAGHNPLAASFSAASGGNDGWLIFLVATMGAVALAAGAVAYRRRAVRRE